MKDNNEYDMQDENEYTVNSLNEEGLSEFHLACQDKEVTEEKLLDLLNKGADPALRDFVSLQNGLHMVLNNSSFKVTTNLIKAMIEKNKAIVYELTVKGSSCLDLLLLQNNRWDFAVFSYLFSEISKENFDFFINALKVDMDRKNCLYRCIFPSEESSIEEKNQKWDMLKFMLKTMAEKQVQLKDLGEDPERNIENYYQGEMLYEACLAKKIDNAFIEYLWKLKANFKYKDKTTNNTFLHVLAEVYNDDDNVLDLRVINGLIKNGDAEIHHENEQGATCLYTALQCKSYLLAFYFIVQGAVITEKIKTDLETLFTDHTHLLGHAVYNLIKKMISLTPPEQEKLITRYKDLFINQFSVHNSFKSFSNPNPKEGVFNLLLVLKALSKNKNPEKRIPDYKLPPKFLKIKIANHLLRDVDPHQCMAFSIQILHQNNILTRCIWDLMPETSQENDKKRKACFL